MARAAGAPHLFKYIIIGTFAAWKWRSFRRRRIARSPRGAPGPRAPGSRKTETRRATGGGRAGDTEVGKSSIMLMFTEQHFQQAHDMTIGASYVS